jgi:hypothetical protein
LSNNDWAVQRRGGSEESRENNVIYIGRASFRMEPATVTAAEIIAPPHVAEMQDAGLDVQHGDASHLSGDIEPPYLRLRTLVDESQVQDRGNQHTPVLDLTEFASLAENTGVEVVGRDAPPLPRTLIADVASFPHAMPTGIEPATEVVVSAQALSFSRTRLFGWGSVAFCAGLLASAAAHMVMAPALVNIGPTANAATVSPTGNAAATVASAATPAGSPASSAPVALAAPAAPEPAAPAPAAQAPVANEPAHADGQILAAPAVPATVRTRSGAAIPARSQTRARGKMRSVPRSASAAAASATEGEEGDWKPAAADSTSDDAPTAAPAARPAPNHGSGWVDPFAQ